jgi:hypothetical protein
MYDSKSSLPHLQQQPHHVWVCPLHIIKHHHAVRPPADGLRQQTTLAVTCMAQSFEIQAYIYRFSWQHICKQPRESCMKLWYNKQLFACSAAQQTNKVTAQGYGMLLLFTSQQTCPELLVLHDVLLSLTNSLVITDDVLLSLTNSLVITDDVLLSLTNSLVITDATPQLHTRGLPPPAC